MTHTCISCNKDLSQLIFDNYDLSLYCTYCSKTSLLIKNSKIIYYYFELNSNNTCYILNASNQESKTILECIHSINTIVVVDFISIKFTQPLLPQVQKIITNLQKYKAFL